MLRKFSGGGRPVDVCDVLLVTATGRLELETELACLRHLRQEAAVEERNDLPVRAPAGRGEVAKSAEVAALDQAISQLVATLARTSIVADTFLQVGVGSRVWLRDEHGEETVVTIVGPLAANAHNNLVSYESALGRSLLGRTSGDTVDIQSLGESWCVQIARIEEMPN